MTIKLPNIYNESTTFNDLSELQQDNIRQFFASLDRVRPVIGPTQDGSGFWLRLHREPALIMDGAIGWRQTKPGRAYSVRQVFFISEEQARAIAATILEALKEQ